MIITFALTAVRICGKEQTMSRYIDAYAVCEMLEPFEDALDDEKVRSAYIQTLTLIHNAPSIDIVRCKECKWAKANGTYQWCGRLDSTAQITADDFCSYGERRGDG